MIETFLQLSMIDREMIECHRQLDEAQSHWALQLDRLSAFERMRREVFDQLEQGRAVHRAQEAHIKGIAQAIDQRRALLNTLPDHHQYGAALRELELLGAQRSDAEERFLRHSAEISSLQERLEQLKLQVEQQRAFVDRGELVLAAERERTSGRVGQLQSEREQLVKAARPDWLKLYQSLLAKLDGDAVAGVIIEDERLGEYTCGGCYLQLPMERINRLLMRAEPVQCPSCARIIVLEEPAGLNRSDEMVPPIR